jgi:D-arabinose 1-dehydrogenase-like Zn-dependent alcohol dehydrogenase
MEPVNKKHKEILNQVFGGNMGLQLQLLRQKLEVMEFLNYCKENNITPNTTQQAHIDKINAVYNEYDSKINQFLGTIALKNMEDPIEDVTTEEVVG